MNVLNITQFCSNTIFGNPVIRKANYKINYYFFWKSINYIYV